MARFKRTKKFRKRPFKSRRFKRRLIRNPNISMGIYSFKRVVNSTADQYFSVDGTVASKASNRLTISNTGSVAGTMLYGTLAYTFTINDLPSVSEFTSLFDSYRIRKVVIKFTPYANTTTATGSSTATTVYGDYSPIMHYAIDHDDGASPTGSEVGIQELQQYASYKTRRLNGQKPFSIVIKPRATTAVYSGSFSQGAVAPRSLWIDCGNNDVEHYGLKAVFEGISPNNTVQYCSVRVETTYYLQFKGIR